MKNTSWGWGRASAEVPLSSQPTPVRCSADAIISDVLHSCKRHASALVLRGASWCTSTHRSRARTPESRCQSPA
eukprot:365424-Chlamydomonas_euryale.AAC.21